MAHQLHRVNAGSCGASDWIVPGTLLIHLILSTVSSAGDTALHLKTVSALIITRVLFTDLHASLTPVSAWLFLSLTKRLLLVLGLTTAVMILSLTYSLNPHYGLQKILHIIVGPIPALALFLRYLESRSNQKWHEALHALILVLYIRQFAFSVSGYEFSPSRWNHVTC